jgi:hypothetical protein
MNRLILFATAILMSCGALAMAQQDPQRPPRPGPGPGGDGGVGDQRLAQRGDGDRPGPGGGGPGGPGGPEGRGPGGGPPPGGPPGVPPQMRPEMAKLTLLGAYIDVVDRLTKMSRDPAAAGVAAVVSTSDILRARGPEAAINYFNKVLPEVKNEAVARAIRIQLIDLYKQSGQSDKALEQLDQLIKGAPAQPAGSPGAPPP